MSAHGIGVLVPADLAGEIEGDVRHLAIRQQRHPLLARALRYFGAVGIVLAALLVAAVLVLAVGPRFFPFQSYVVLTGSMAPTMPVGTIVILTPADVSELVVGDVMTFNHPERRGEVVTHRIVSLTENPQGRVIETKGDANALPDSWKLVGKGQTWRLAFAIPYLGHVFSALQLPLVRQLLLILPALWLGVWLLRDIWSPQPQGARA